MRWGLSISLSEELADPRAIADVAATAEASGWDGIFVWDHLWNRTLQPFADPWVTLAAVAAATERVTVGTMITPLPRHRVQLVAQATTTLDRLSGGRMVLALGLGVDSYGEFSLFDEAPTDDKARAAALDAGIGLLVPMLEGGPVPQLDGRVTTAAGVQAPRVPIWIAGVSPATDWKGWRSSARGRGRRSSSSRAWPVAAWNPARWTSPSSVRRTLILRRWRPPVRRGASPRSSRGRRRRSRG